MANGCARLTSQDWLLTNSDCFAQVEILTAHIHDDKRPVTHFNGMHLFFEMSCKHTWTRLCNQQKKKKHIHETIHGI